MIFITSFTYHLSNSLSESDIIGSTWNCYSMTELHIINGVGVWSIISSICPIIHPSICLVIHPSCHGLFIPTENGWLCLQGLSRVAFQAFAFPVLPFSSQSGKVYEKNQEKKKTCLWWKNRKNTYYFFFF
jgi:hypothetical protein